MKVEVFSGKQWSLRDGRAEYWLGRFIPLIVILVLLVIVVLPLIALLQRSLFDQSGHFVGLDNFRSYFSDAGLETAAVNSILFSSLTAFITISLAYPYAYALTRCHMPGRPVFRLIGMTSILAPSLLSSLGLVYLFGRQGILRDLLLGETIYGPIGIVMGSVFYTFPHAMLILITGLSTSDARLYESARALKASSWSVFKSITLPASRYSLISAASVSFILTFTDFGIPSVIGGSTNVLSTDIYKLVIGRFDFELGAVVGVLLMIPAAIAFLIDHWAQKNQRGSFNAKSVFWVPQPHVRRDTAAFIFCSIISIIIIGIIGMAVIGSLVEFWPYNLSFSLKNYNFADNNSVGWAPIKNSLLLATGTAFVGVLLTLFSAWVVSRDIGGAPMRKVIQALSMLPVTIPGLVLGLGYVFFFNSALNPLQGLQGTLFILVLCSVAHFLTVPHVTLVTTLMRIDREIDMAGQSLKAPALKTARRAIFPIIAPTIIDVASYFFINALTTVSALVFIYGVQTKVASITVINLSENGKLGQATAVAITIFAMAAIAALVQLVLRRFAISLQPWRKGQG